MLSWPDSRIRDVAISLASERAFKKNGPWFAQERRVKTRNQSRAQMQSERKRLETKAAVTLFIGARPQFQDDVLPRRPWETTYADV